MENGQGKLLGALFINKILKFVGYLTNNRLPLNGLTINVIRKNASNSSNLMDIDLTKLQELGILVSLDYLLKSLEFSSIDVSFISLTKVLQPIRNYLSDDGEIVALIKPQFEAGREKVGKKGVVREKSTHLEVIAKVIDYAVSIGFFVQELEFSPIKGPEGNIEYLVHLKKTECPGSLIDEKKQAEIVDLAFDTLAK